MAYVNSSGIPLALGKGYWLSSGLLKPQLKQDTNARWHLPGVPHFAAMGHWAPLPTLVPAAREDPDLGICP